MNANFCGGSNVIQKKRWLFAVIGAMAYLLVMTPGVRAEPAPVQVVERLQDTLLKVMKNAGKLGYEGRYKVLAPVLSDLYDFPFISRIVLGRHWNAFNDKEKKRFLALFTKFSIAVYANRFDGYSGERFKVITADTSRKVQAVVRTELVQSSGKRVNMDYVLRQKGGQWRIINVVVEGVSDLALKHADFGDFLTKNDPKALLELLKTKIAKLSGHDPTRD